MARMAVAENPTGGALAELDVLVVDCQTTGASPEHGQMIELGWGLTRATDGELRVGVESRLIRLSDEARYSERVAEITGISRELLETGEERSEVLGALRRDGTSADVAVAHYAQFERRFLVETISRLNGSGAGESAVGWLCTHRIAERLYPGLPRLGLRALAGFLGHPVERPNRAGSHVRATAQIWWRLVAELDEQLGIRTLAELTEWLAGDKAENAAGGERLYAVERGDRLALPDKPGVYRLLDANGEPLYVGRASSLRSRVNQYFQTTRGLSGRKLELVSQVHDITYDLWPTALEAALAESDAIKQLGPPYNEALQLEKRTVAGLKDEVARLAPQVRSVGGVSGSRMHLPAGQREIVRGLCAVVEVWRSGSGFDRLEALIPGDIEETALATESAFDAFRSAVALGREASLEEWLTVGAELRKADREQEVAEDEEAERTYVDAFESLVRHGTELLERAAWLRRMTGGAVAWHPSRWRDPAVEGWRFIGWEHGEVVARETIPAEEARQRVESWSGEDCDVESVAMYDRLRVLRTQVRGFGGEQRIVGAADPE